MPPSKPFQELWRQHEAGWPTERSLYRNLPAEDDLAYDTRILGLRSEEASQALIRAKGHIDLGISEVTLHSNFLFESATDSHGANVIKIGLTVLTLSLGDFLNIGPASGLIVITSTGFAAKFTVPLAFTFGWNTVWPENPA